MQTKRVKRFKQVQSMNFISVECPDCKRHFGLTIEMIECMDANVHYTCPYCGKNHGIEG